MTDLRATLEEICDDAAIAKARECGRWHIAQKGAGPEPDLPLSVKRKVAEWSNFQVEIKITMEYGISSSVTIEETLHGTFEQVQLFDDDIDLVIDALITAREAIKRLSSCEDLAGYEDLAGLNGEAPEAEGLRKLQAERLREARKLRGFPSARAAQLRYGWSSAYCSHENGTRGIGRAYREYARKFAVNPAWLLGHSEQRD
jgi:hypothetical protein